MTESEQQLEEKLIRQLNGLGYESVEITNSDQLKDNLKKQLEKHNDVSLSDDEFKKVLNHLDKGNVFDKAKILRDRVQITRDDGTSIWIRFLNTQHWCQNEYQVTHQVTVQGTYVNRYDVTLLINGLPLVQIELKRRGMELKEAFNQVNRYQRHSFWAESGLFQYVQVFVISNGVDTKYYANNRDQDYKQTFFWADKENKKMTQLEEFTENFLEKCHVSKMICKHIVLHESNKVLMILRPYQYYAAEEIFDRVKHGRKNGYIWHTTGSGKTLTSFKAAQLLTELPKVQKVLFVVDRADLDYQTTKEFNHFSDGCVDGTDNTKSLVKQLSGDNKLIVTTIQKLNSAITKNRHVKSLEDLQNQRVVFIFDECHRSQFGYTHKNITTFFKNAQLFGFTGTPIFADNASKNELGKRTTADLFEKCLHKYVITNAIADENVLKFSVEYWGKLKRKDGELIDEEVSSINVKEFFENPERIEGVVDWIIKNHNKKTHDKRFSSILCVGSVDALTTYYDLFKQKKENGEHDLRIATIFTYTANEEDADADGLIGDPNFDVSSNGNNGSKHSREKLDEYIADYNSMYKAQFSTKDSQSFYNYYKDIAKKLKERDRKNFDENHRIDILLVVNMFLTGFDAKKLNTLYVDKNLKYHGLIQAYSRTNRTLGELKSHGNIVCFRNLKKKTDEAISLFSDPNAQEHILIDPYEHYVKDFNKAVELLRSITKDPDAVNDLIREDEILNFVKAFRNVMRILNTLKSFSEFSFKDLDMTAQTFEDFKSKYLDIHDRVKKPSGDDEGASIINEVNFELELIHRDEINVAYILDLLDQLRTSEKSDPESKEKKTKKKRAILNMLSNETQLRSKKELIERFIEEYFPKIKEEENIKDVFAKFWTEERTKAITVICDEEKLDKDSIMQIISEYNFTGKEPLRETVFAAAKVKPKLLERKTMFDRIVTKLKEFVDKFEHNIGNF